MCRLLGVVAAEPTAFQLALRDAPRSLATLSKAHPDGWGVAVFQTEWSLEKGTLCAGDDHAFLEHARKSTGRVLVSHIRQKTVGDTSVENTHPFRFGPWVFAHNGTIQDRDFLRGATAPEDAAWIRGQTDSELFFAYVVSRMREAGVLDAEPSAKTDALLSDLVAEARARANFGAFNFLLSNGDTTYAHRFGRSLFLLARGTGESMRALEIDSTASPCRAFVARQRAILIASEKLTDEHWEEIPEGTLLRIDRRPTPTYRIIPRG